MTESAKIMLTINRCTFASMYRKNNNVFS